MRSNSSRSICIKVGVVKKPPSGVQPRFLVLWFCMHQPKLRLIVPKFGYSFC